MVINKEIGRKESVTDFYNGKAVFITGGTGFLGKVFIAKFLTACPKLKKIYLLMREKKGVCVQKRIIDLLENPVFSTLRKENPEVLKKIVPVAGDVTALNLGISEDDEKELIENVSIVYHVAADVKFNQSLRQALKNNVEGTMQVLNLCQRMKKIQMLVHISTTYSQCLNNVIEEKLYPPPMDLTDVYFKLKEADVDDITKITGAGWPNTYTFTKSLAEHYLAKNRGNVPIIIIRPSIVAPIEQAPLEGWLENWYGATGILAAIDKGLCRVLYGADENLVDLIPVDYVANLSIIAPASNESSKDVTVYNSCSSSCNPLTLRELIDFYVGHTIDKHDAVFPFTSLNVITKYRWIVMLITFITAIIPAYTADAVRWFRGKSPRYVTTIYRIMNSRDSLDFFTSNSWVIKNDRVRSLFSSLSPEDQKTFPCDPTPINWPQYMAKYKIGVRLFLERKKIKHVD